MTKAKAETALAKPQTVGSFLALSGDSNASALLAENMEDGKLSPLDLEKITIPTGGQCAWSVPNLEGDNDFVKSFEAIILFHKTGRVYWSKSIDEGGGNTPPECHCEDGVKGIGKPGGICSMCPFNQFKSAEKGEGKACKEQRAVFIIRPNDHIPSAINLPPTSLQACRKYMIRLANSGKGYWTVVTRFELEKAQNKGGINYAKLKISFVRDLNPDEATRLTEMRNLLIPQFKQVSVADMAQQAPEGIDVNDAPDFKE